MLPVQGAWVQSLVWELRSYMLCGTSKNFKESLEEVTCLPSLIIQFTSLNTTLRILWIELDQELNGEKRREKTESIKAKAVVSYLENDSWEATDTQCLGATWVHPAPCSLLVLLIPKFRNAFINSFTDFLISIVLVSGC